MTVLIQALIVLIILFHVFVFFMESIFWRTPYAIKLLGTTAENASATSVLAMNQGVYNLFLAAGLTWSLIATGPISFDIKVFFLSCVVIAGVVGGFSVSKRVFIMQGLPALVALVLILV